MSYHLRITYQDMSGASHEMEADVDEDSTFEEVLQIVSEKTHIPISDLKADYNNEIRNRDDDLVDYLGDDLNDTYEVKVTYYHRPA